jgi:hypothetical protein
VNRGVFRKYCSGDQLYQRSGITQCGWELHHVYQPLHSVRRLPSHRNLVTSISSSQKQINIPPAFELTTSHPHSLRLDLRKLRTTIRSFHLLSKFQDGCPKLNRHPRREQSICAVQVGVIGYVGFCSIMRNTLTVFQGSLLSERCVESASRFGVDANNSPEFSCTPVR